MKGFLMKTYPRKGRKRLSVDIPARLHKKLKKMALKRNCTITRYILAAVILKLGEEEKYE